MSIESSPRANNDNPRSYGEILANYRADLIDHVQSERKAHLKQRESYDNLLDNFNGHEKSDDPIVDPATTADMLKNYRLSLIDHLHASSNEVQEKIESYDNILAQVIPAQEMVKSTFPTPLEVTQKAARAKDAESDNKQATPEAKQSANDANVTSQETPTDSPQNVDEKVPEPEKQDESDPYQVGQTVRTWIARRNKKTKVEDTISAQLGFATIKERMDDGQTFKIEITDPNGRQWIEEAIRSDLENANKIVLPEFTYTTEGRKPIGNKEWTITEGPDEDGNVKLTDGNKTILRNHNSLAVWRHLRSTDKEFQNLPVAATQLKFPEQAPTPTDEENAQKFIDELKTEQAVTPEDEAKAREFIASLAPEAEAEVSPALEAGKKPNTDYPFSEKTKKRVGRFERFMHSPGFTSQLERDTARLRRRFSKEKAAVATQAKSDREALKGQLRGRFSGGQELVDRYANSPLGMLDRKVISRIGSVLRLRQKPLSERVKEDLKQQGENERKRSAQRRQR